MSALRTAMLLLSTALAAPSARAQDALDRPWEDPSRALVIDVFAGNAVDWDALATEPRVVGVIHKATQGLRADERYAQRRREARERGYAWGSYHLAQPGDPVAQADFYLDLVGDDAGDELLALDLESLHPRRGMTIARARRFLRRVRERTGRSPLVYGNHAVISRLAALGADDPDFGPTALWYARFAPRIDDFPEGTWSRYALWQFASEVNCRSAAPCPLRLAGTPTDVDVNVYDGTPDELRARWPL